MTDEGFGCWCPATGVPNSKHAQKKLLKTGMSVEERLSLSWSSHMSSNMGQSILHESRSEGSLPRERGMVPVLTQPMEQAVLARQAEAAPEEEAAHGEDTRRRSSQASTHTHETASLFTGTARCAHVAPWIHATSNALYPVCPQYRPHQWKVVE